MTLLKQLMKNSAPRVLNYVNILLAFLGSADNLQSFIPIKVTIWHSLVKKANFGHCKNFGISRSPCLCLDL